MTPPRDVRPLATRGIPRPVAAVLAVAAVAALAFGGCSPKKLLAPNTEPQTTVFVQFDASDTVNHTVHHEVHLYWYGTDVDGYVVAYDIRFVEPGGPADPPWTRTSRTDSLFEVQVPTGTLAPTFEVRAIDNDGSLDSSPASQTLSLSNEAPILTLLDPPRTTDTTFATQTLVWSGIDPDGDASKLVYHVWLDGNEATPHVTTARQITFPSADFLQTGHYRSGPRTAYVQAIDAGGRASDIQSAPWYVRSPVADTTALVGRLLLIDNNPTTNPAPAPNDNVYNQAVNRAVISGVRADQISVLRLQTNRPFRSAADLYQTLKLFDAVVWYRGSERYQSARDTLLVRENLAVRRYVEEGGRFYFESLDMIDGASTNGILSLSFLQNVLECDSLHRYKPLNSDDYSEDWGINSGSVLRSPPYTFDDSLRCNSIFGGLRGFAPRDTHTVVLWGRANTLVPAVPYDIPVALRVLSDVSPGRIIVVSVPLVGMNGYGSVPRFLDKVFADLGVSGAATSFARQTTRSTLLNQRLRASVPRR